MRHVLTTLEGDDSAIPTTTNPVKPDRTLFWIALVGLGLYLASRRK